MGAEDSVFRSLEIIEQRINEKLTVESIAADIYISKFHYMRLFREIVGDSVMDYVIKRKLTLAAEALLESDTSILDIALDYGYDSRDGFTRSFKTYMGVTPAEYRKKPQNTITALYDASSFCDRVVKPVTDPSPEQHNIKVMQDIVYMENVIFFYAIGEIDYLCGKLTGSEHQEQKDDFERIKTKINEYRKIAFYAERDESDISIFNDITNILCEIISDLYRAVDNCGASGGAIKLIADELGRLADKTRSLAEETEGL